MSLKINLNKFYPVEENQILTEHQKFHEKVFLGIKTSPCSAASAGVRGDFTDNWKLDNIISLRNNEEMKLRIHSPQITKIQIVITIGHK